MATDLWDDLASIVDAPDSFAIKGGDKGSVKAKADFNAGEDVVALRKAIEGLGTTDKTLIDILSHRSSSQREAICKAYLAATNRTLVDDLKGDTHGNFERLLVALATPPDVYDAQEVMRAMEGVGTEDSTLIEIFASRTNQQVKALAAAYLEETERKLTFDLKKEVSGQFGDALLLLAQGNRDETIAVDQNMAKEDAKALYDAGEKKLGTDEDQFIEILCKRSIPQLRQTFVAYKEISGRTLQKSIEREMSGTLEELLVAIVKCAKNVPAYFAERLQYSVKGIGTDEKTLTRIMVCRSELDMLDIRTEFKKLAEKSLHDAIESDVSGSFGDCLKMICGGED